MVDTIHRELDARLSSVVEELSRQWSYLAENAVRNPALRSVMAELCRAVHDAVAQSRRLSRVAQSSRRKATTPKVRSSNRALPEARLRKVMAFIDTSLDQRLDVATLAAVAGMSPGHFAATFKCATGMPPHEAVTCRRVARSQELLAEETLSVAAIGCQLGFSSHSHFCTAFRRRTGLSPTAWRRLQRGRTRPVNHHTQSTFSVNTRSYSEKSESHQQFGRDMMGRATEPPRHTDTGASRPGTA
jgi:AraC-like DNA-binding protein